MLLLLSIPRVQLNKNFLLFATGLHCPSGWMREIIVVFITWTVIQKKKTRRNPVKYTNPCHDIEIKYRKKIPICLFMVVVYTFVRFLFFGIFHRDFPFLPLVLHYCVYHLILILKLPYTHTHSLLPACFVCLKNKENEETHFDYSVTTTTTNGN